MGEIKMDLTIIFKFKLEKETNNILPFLTKLNKFVEESLSYEDYSLTIADKNEANKIVIVRPIVED